ncbi:uncharacterized protein PV09_00837 [Verruconis gallopava]|uniref:RRM domain-containing protein n=1 Tax=Verruconis gallopava TaxID=253628 RepID=A0A0D2BC29_9PEZI|nr:uncharacterized protein PV09_00837 [Verruconis gallopava]KIW08919.1 hypothetical protein PV09_00837 [Verruconis gallopava]
MSTANSDKEAIFVVVDLPRDGPFKTWQKFKDVARTALSNGHKPGWTEMKSQADGSTVGYTLCKTREDAKLIFDYLMKLTASGCCAHVHWYDTSWSKSWPVACSCPTEQHRSNYDYYRHHVHSLTHYQSSQYIVLPNPVAYPHPTAWGVTPAPVISDPVHTLATDFQSMGLSRPYYAPVEPVPAPYYAVQSPQAPAYVPATQPPANYVTNSHGYPVNTTNGVVQSEHNVIILKNLDPDITEQELYIVLGKTVSPTSLDIKRTSDSKKKSISAVATYNSYKDVKRVCEHFRGRNIHVRKRVVKAEIGKDSSPRSAVQPAVVNGSTTVS